MDKFILIILLTFSYANSDKYNRGMSKAIDLFKTAESSEDFLKASNFFYRISQAVDDNWLPGYYYALCNFQISLKEKDSFIKENIFSLDFTDYLKVQNTISF